MHAKTSKLIETGKWGKKCKVILSIK
jgi:hypothetical protein